MVHSRLFADYGNVENSSFVLWRVTAWRMKILLSIAFLKVRARSFEAGRSGGGLG